MVQKLLRGLLLTTNNFCFLNIAKFSALSYSFVVCGGVGWVVGGFQEITKSQPNYNFDYFAVGVMVVVGL